MTRPTDSPDTLAIAREISAIARIGLHFSKEAVRSGVAEAAFD